MDNDKTLWFLSVFCTCTIAVVQNDLKRFNVDLKLPNINKNKVKIEAIRYRKCSKSSNWNFVGNFVKSKLKSEFCIDRVPLFQ